MQRRNFILATVAAFPTLAIGQSSKPQPQRSKKGLVVKAGQSRFNEKTLVGGNNPNDIKVSAKDTNGDLTVFEYTSNGKGGPPLHVHPYQDEVFFILAGEYLFQVGEDQHYLKAGDTIFLLRTVPHAFAQITEQGKMFYLFQPSGKMEEFFRTIGNLTSPPTPEQGAKIWEAHHMKVVGPPLSY